VRETLPKLGVELVDMENTSCCGFPALSSISMTAWLYLSSRIMAIAEDMGLDLLPLCNGCHLSFMETKDHLEKDPDLRKIIQDKLEKEDLNYEGKVKIFHLIEVLHDEIGPEEIKSLTVKPLTGYKIAAHPGCHAIRPSYLQHVDDPENPQKLDSLIRAIGAETFDYPEKIDCCGSQLAVSSGRSTLKIAGDKLEKLPKYGFDALTTTCPFCFKMFDGRQRAIKATLRNPSLDIPVFYYTQLLGLALGSDIDKLGLIMNQSPVDKIIGDFVEK
jgi:heterodisulfide reductase subunit B